jgi:arginine-tRNA-protein transferase
VTHPKELPLASLQFYATAPYPCSYLPGRMARSQVATPSHLIHADAYSGLVANGFRRSGMFTYRPYCDGCRACLPLRVPVASFVPTRSQRRARRARPSEARAAPVLRRRALPALPALSGRLPHRRWHGPDRSTSTPSSCCKAASTRAWSSSASPPRRQRRAQDGVDPRRAERRPSAVYTYSSSPSRDVALCLWQSATRLLGLPRVYLGYWIEGSGKMAYKAQFGPHELLVGGEWQPAAVAAPG